jgi:hypothetical protein
LIADPHITFLAVVHTLPVLLRWITSIAQVYIKPHYYRLSAGNIWQAERAGRKAEARGWKPIGPRRRLGGGLVHDSRPEGRALQVFQTFLCDARHQKTYFQLLLKFFEERTV